MNCVHKVLDTVQGEHVFKHEPMVRSKRKSSSAKMLISVTETGYLKWQKYSKHGTVSDYSTYSTLNYLSTLLVEGSPDQ
jgi:hypothetical protein